MPDAETIRWDRCPICRSGDRSSLVEFEFLAFVRCQCGLVYKSRDKASSVGTTDATYHERYDRRQAHRVRKARRQILDVLNHVEPGPLLDVGCSLGYALQAAADLGLEAKGLDLNESLLEPTRERGFDVRVGDVTGPYPFADSAFNIVILKHVFEHTADPRAALSEVRRVLKPGGGVFIAVPNGDYIKARLMPKTHTFFQPETGGRYHFVYYTPKLLRRLLNDAGFRTVRLHPHLWHRRVDMRARLSNLVSWSRWAVEGHVSNALGLAREFWLVAVREPD